MEQMLRNKWVLPLLGVALFATLMAGCTSKHQTPQERAEAAKTLFEQTTKSFHIPSADAVGALKTTLQEQAAHGYQEILGKYPEQRIYAAQADRSLGNIRAAQGKLDEAVRHYAAVGTKYPQQEWEVLMAWKSAADLLWENGRKGEAAQFYEKIVNRFDTPEATSVMKMAVRGSKARLGPLS
jgi:TolA-binding protein